MKRYFSLLFACLLAPVLTQNASAYNFNDKIYGKASVKVGFNYKYHTGTRINTYLKDWNKTADIEGYPQMFVHIRCAQYYVTLSAGYDFFYKLNDMLHPFAGFEATGMLPIGSRTFARQYPYRPDAEMPKRMLSTVQEYFVFNQRTGVKINPIKNVAILSYATLGFNILKTDRFRKNDVEHAITSVGISVGAGIETMFLDRFSFALEYRFTRNKSIGFGTSSYAMKCYTDGHNAMAKFGYYFL